MRCEVTESEDYTTLFLRWEICLEFKEAELLQNIGGPVVLALSATNYIDLAGKFHERTEVEVPIYPHPGRRNFGQGKFTDYESRRSFWQRLQGAVIDQVTLFVYDAAPGSVGVEGHVIRADSAYA